MAVDFTQLQAIQSILVIPIIRPVTQAAGTQVLVIHMDSLIQFTVVLAHGHIGDTLTSHAWLILSNGQAFVS
jgi:hypothetical protein